MNHNTLLIINLILTVIVLILLLVPFSHRR